MPSKLVNPMLKKNYLTTRSIGAFVNPQDIGSCFPVFDNEDRSEVLVEV